MSQKECAISFREYWPAESTFGLSVDFGRKLLRPLHVIEREQMLSGIQKSSVSFRIRQTLG